MQERPSSLTAWARAGTLWAVLAAYAYFVGPASALAVALFIALLSAALVFTLVPLCRWAGARLRPAPIRRPYAAHHARRQGLLLAVLVVANLALLAAHAWHPLVPALGLVALGIEEAVALAPK